MHYLQFPILGKYSINESISVEAGPVFGYLLFVKYEATLTSEGLRERIDVTDSFKPIDIALGMGVSFKLKSKLFFGLRYNFGHTEINDKDFNSSKLQSNIFQASEGYFF